MKILFIGDIFAEAGRRAVQEMVPKIRKEHGIDFIVANCENIAAGLGVTPALAEDLFAVPIDVLTSGNHIFHHKEILPYIQHNKRLLRPDNYSPLSPGSGKVVLNSYGGVRIAVLNLIGQIYMAPADNPFIRADQLLKSLEHEADIILVDFHAEASAEKMAFGRYLDGRVSAVVGTHTHVPTADETIFPGGTGYITDIGMTGPYDSVIGTKTELAIQRMTTGIHVKYYPAVGDVRCYGVILEVEERNGRTISIKRVEEKLK